MANKLHAFRETVERLWKHYHLGWYLWFGFSVLWLYWKWHIPSPGKAVAMLAVVAAVMSIRDLSGIAKVCWIVLLFGFLLLEVKSIDRDRAELAEEQKKAHAQEEKNFSTIADGLKNAIEESQRQFVATMTKTEAILDTTQSVSALTHKNLVNITGGRSFAYIRPQVEAADKGPIALVVWNHGSEILTGVTVSISRINDPNWGAEFFNRYMVGTIGPHDVAMIPITITPKVGEDGIDSYWIMISAQNGTVDERLQFRESKKSPGSWAVSFKVSERLDLSEHVRGFPTLMLRSWSDEPNSERKVDTAAQIRMMKQNFEREKLKHRTVNTTD